MNKGADRKINGHDTEELIKQKGELFKKIQDRKTAHQNLIQQLQPVINNLQQEADRLAVEFRRLFQESQQAYQNEDGALAKGLSLEGRDAQKKCEELNNLANRYKSELNSGRNKIDELYVLLNDINDQLKTRSEEPQSRRKTKVAGFGNGQVISNAEVEKLLDQLPQGLFDLVSEIKFVDEIKISNGNLITGNYHWNPEIGKAQIDVYAHGFKNTDNKKQVLAETKRTVIHEIGHLIFKEVLADTARHRWGTYYFESLQTKNFLNKRDPGSRGEDFSDCFIEFVYNPKKLEKYDQTRYTFIKKVWEITIGF